MNKNPLKSSVFLLGFFIFGLANSSEGKQYTPSLFMLGQYSNEQNIQGWVMSEKLDGIRAYWDGDNLYTRQGNIINAPVWFTRDFPKFELDGELWMGRGVFAETLAVVKDKIPSKDWQKISYQVFEVPNQKGSFLARLKVLESYLEKHAIPHLKVTLQKKQ